MNDATRLNIVSLVLKEKGIFKIRVEGNSMYPLILNGDMAIVEKIDKIKVGHVYLINDNNTLKIHRCVKKNITKGDNAYELDKNLISFIGVAKYVIRDEKIILLNKHCIVSRLIAYFSYIRGLKNQFRKNKKLDKFPLNIYKRIVYRLTILFWGS